MARMESPLRAKVFNSERRKRKRVKVDFMGMDVWAWELMAAQRSEIEQHRYRSDKTGKVSLDLKYERALVVLYGAFDSDQDSANRLFLDGDANNINELPAIEVDRLYEAIAGLSGMKPGAEEDAKKDSEKKDPEPDPGSGGSSGSLVPTNGQASPGACDGSPVPSSPTGSPSTESSPPAASGTT